MRPLLLLALLLASTANAAVVTVLIDTTDEGASQCVAITPETPGDYYVRMKAHNAAGDESLYTPSTTLVKAFPAQLCWTNPTHNIDGSPLSDLTHVSIYYDAVPVLSPAVPNAPVAAISISSTCQPGDCQSATVVRGETSQALNVTWDTQDGPFSVRVFEWPGGTVPIAQSTNLSNNSFTWTPNRAGVYSMQIDGQTLTSAITYLFYIELAAPTGGGID